MCRRLLQQESTALQSDGPIGKQEVFTTAFPSQLIHFFQSHYDPDSVTLSITF